MPKTKSPKTKSSTSKSTEKAVEPDAKGRRLPVGILWNEAGSSGLKEAWGFISEAYNAALYFPEAVTPYSKMRRSTPEIVSIRAAFTSWSRNINPQVNLPEKATDDDKKYQEFVLSVLNDVEGGFSKLIDTMVNHVPFMGWGWWEAVPGLRDPNWTPPGDDDWKSEADDNLIGIRRFAWRDPATFNGWDMDEKTKRMKGLKQQDYPHEPVTLPLNKSLHVTFGDSNNPEGLSPLEAVWRLERLKYGYEVVMGIGAEHAAGHLKIKKTESGDASGTDKTAMATAAKNLLTAQQGNFGYFPYGIDGEVIDVPFGAGTFLLETVKYYSTMIYLVYMMQFVALNTMTSTGAQASQVDSTDMAVFTFNAMMDGFASQFDAQIGKRLYDWNVKQLNAFPGVEKRPKITFSHIDKTIALSEMGSFLTQIDGLLNLGDDDIKSIRKRTGGLLSENEPDRMSEAQRIRMMNENKPPPGQEVPVVEKQEVKPEEKPIEKT